jgi:prevent-host-death family protein
MPEIGIRELKAQVSDVIRTVNEKQATYVVTRHGRPVALLLPLEAAPPRQPVEAADTAWEELTRLGKEIGEHWQSEKSSVEILSEIRR